MVSVKEIIPVLLFLSAGFLQAAEVTAKLSADSIPVGQGVMLSVNVSGGRLSGEPEIPIVDNLIINSQGTSQSIQIINGDITRSLTYNYVVGSNTEGTYEIPAIRLTVDGKQVLTKLLKLKVVAAADAQPKGMKGDEEEQELVDYGRLTMQMVEKDRKHVYPGEIAPIKIQAYFPATSGVSLKGAPRPEGSAFTLHNLSTEPEQTNAVIDGKRYLVVTWFGGLSATKAGRYPASIVIEGTVTIRDTTARRRRAPSAFNDPFFDDFFAPMIRKDIKLTTDSENNEVEVVELPQDGRPDNFTGAIGKFVFESVTIPSLLQTGDPCRIEAVLKGEGNFSLLSAPQPIPGAEWKSYSGTTEFEAGDVASFGGRKAFSYSAVPLVPGDKEVELSYSYFDPDLAEYIEVRSTPQKVTISGEIVTNPSLEDSKPQVQASPSLPQLAPLATSAGGVRSYDPLTVKAWFIPVMASCGLIALCVLGFGWWRAKEVDLAKRSKQELDRAVQVALSDTEKAVSAGNAVAFFSAAREALSLCVADKKGINPEAVTAADLAGMEDESIVRIFTEADRVDYSGRKYAAADLAGWKVKLDTVMNTLTSNKKNKTR